MASEIEKGIADIELGGWDNITQGVLYFGIALLQIPQAISTCENTGDDIAAIEQWAQIFKNPVALAAQVSKVMLFHKDQVMADVNSVEADWKTANFFQSGVDVADLLTLVVGPIEVATI